MLVDFGLCEMHADVSLAGDKRERRRPEDPSDTSPHNSREPVTLVSRGYIHPTSPLAELEDLASDVDLESVIIELQEAALAQVPDHVGTTVSARRSASLRRGNALKEIAQQSSASRLRRQIADRAGTPSFRAPEVLLSVKAQSQGT